MITVILKNKSGEELEEVSKPGNEAFLRQEGVRFPLLSQLSEYSPDIFGAPDIPELLAEFELIAKSLVDPQSVNHVKEIIELIGRAAKKVLSYCSPHSIRT